MKYNWLAGLYWDCLYAQWGHDIAREITQARIPELSAFEYWANESSGHLVRKAKGTYCRVI